MRHDAIVLDEHRGMAAQKATEIRRRLSEVEADQAALRGRRTELEKFLIAAPAPTWREAAEKARYLIGLFATTSMGARSAPSEAHCRCARRLQQAGGRTGSGNCRA
ncbi:MAG TPA: hypothetical protein VLE23_08975 [Geminicoccaceae bacterium]|nr:hypothetical protein [Geminicoccaceae bacterium]